MISIYGVQRMRDFTTAAAMPPVNLQVCKFEYCSQLCCFVHVVSILLVLFDVLNIV